MVIRILGKDYTVEQSTEVQMAGAFGAANRQKQKICISKDQGRDQYKDTLLHEVLHIIAEELRIDLNEDDIHRLAVGLYSAGCEVKGEVKHA